MSDTCKSCGAPIKWAVTPKGHRMPLDVESVENGNVHLVIVQPGDRLEAHVAPGGTHRAHFVSCSRPRRHKKRKGRADETCQ